MSQQTLSPNVLNVVSKSDAWQRSKAHIAAIVNKIHAATNLDELFLELKDDLAELFSVEQMTLYAVDRDKRELYSRLFLDSLRGVQEIRVPIDDSSISGHCAKYGKVVNIMDAYDARELAQISSRVVFNRSWDERSGFRTRQMLAVPILMDHKYLMGVLLLINKRHGGRFSPQEELFAQEIAETLSIALRHQTQLAQRRPEKFGYLLEQQFLSKQDLDLAVTEARRKRIDVETILVEQYRIAKKAVGESLSRFFGCPFVEFDEHNLPDRALLKGLNHDYLKANFWLPLRRDEEVVEVLIDNPKDLLKIEHIQMLLPGAKIRWLVGLRKDIVQYLAFSKAKHQELGSMQDILRDLPEGEWPVTEEEEDSNSIREDDSAVVRLANQIIVDAYNRGASDIHIEPYAARQDTVVRIRIDGICQEYQRIPPAYRRPLVSRLKIMARLDIAERRKPQDGKIKFRLPTGRDIELRVATLPTAGGDEDVVMRILAASEPLPMDALYMAPGARQAFDRLIRQPYGLVLVVGPTGSGKTTTLHAALGSINTMERKIWTAEDPVEITQYGLRQVQVQPRIGFTFAAAMRAFLRADPDVIMVGEMRDRETAQMGIEASLTGHLVFSTLHTNSAPETITRLLDMGLDPFNFADALLGVLAQRLARTLCKACKVPYTPMPEEIEQLAVAYGPGFEALVDGREIFLHRGVGCATCQGRGYKGRIGLHELLVGSAKLRQLIQERAPVSAVQACAQQEGMRTLLQDGIWKVLEGLTDFAQVRTVASK